MLTIAFTDTETTGLKIGEDRFVELYASFWDYRDGCEFGTINQRFNPGRAISPEAQAVHRISAADLVSEPAWEVYAADFHRVLSGVDLFVAHNGDGFDFPFLNFEFGRVGLPPLDIPTFDTMLSGRWGTPQGKVPNLAELCFACGINYDPALAHSAAYDVTVMRECFLLGVKWGFFHLPDSFVEKSLKVAA